MKMVMVNDVHRRQLLQLISGAVRQSVFLCRLGVPHYIHTAPLRWQWEMGEYICVWYTVWHSPTSTSRWNEQCVDNIQLVEERKAASEGTVTASQWGNSEEGTLYGWIEGGLQCTSPRKIQEQLDSRKQKEKNLPFPWQDNSESRPERTLRTSDRNHKNEKYRKPFGQGTREYKTVENQNK